MFACRGGLNQTSKQTGGKTVLDLEEARREFWKQAAWGLVFGLAFNLKRWRGFNPVSNVHLRFVTDQEKWREAVGKAGEDGKAGEAVELLGSTGDRIWWAVQVLRNNTSY